MNAELIVNDKNLDITKNLFIEIKSVIEEGKQQVAQAVNMERTFTYFTVHEILTNVS